MTGTSRNSTHLFLCTCFFTGCLSKDVTGSLFSIFLVIFCVHTVCLSKDVTGHCSFYCIALPLSLFLPDFLFVLVFIASFQDFFCAHTVCLSKDVTGRCSFHCIALPRPPFYLIISIFLVTFVSLQDFFSLYFHSVSVQRRDRYSVIYFDLVGSL